MRHLSSASRFLPALAAMAPLTAPPAWSQGNSPAPKWCKDNYAVTRFPYFGDLHVHTTRSVDAVVFNVLGTPTNAYEFAQGGQILLAPYDGSGNGTRPLELRRPLGGQPPS